MYTEAFRIKFMSTSKSLIQVLKTRWAGPGPAHHLTQKMKILKLTIKKQERNILIDKNLQEW